MAVAALGTSASILSLSSTMGAPPPPPSSLSRSTGLIDKVRQPSSVQVQQQQQLPSSASLNRVVAFGSTPTPDPGERVRINHNNHGGGGGGGGSGGGGASSSSSGKNAPSLSLRPVSMAFSAGLPINFLADLANATTLEQQQQQQSSSSGALRQIVAGAAKAERRGRGDMQQTHVFVSPGGGGDARPPRPSFLVRSTTASPSGFDFEAPLSGRCSTSPPPPPSSVPLPATPLTPTFPPLVSPTREHDRKNRVLRGGQEEDEQGGGGRRRGDEEREEEEEKERSETTTTTRRDVYELERYVARVERDHERARHEWTRTRCELEAQIRSLQCELSHVVVVNVSAQQTKDVKTAANGDIDGDDDDDDEDGKYERDRERGGTRSFSSSSSRDEEPAKTMTESSDKVRKKQLYNRRWKLTFFVRTTRVCARAVFVLWKRGSEKFVVVVVDEHPRRRRRRSFCFWFRHSTSALQSECPSIHHASFRTIAEFL